MKKEKDAAKKAEQLLATHRRDWEAISSQLHWFLTVFDAPAPVFQGLDSHNGNRIFFIREGTGEVRAEKQSSALPFRPGFAYLLPRRTPVEMRFDEGVKLFCIEFQLEIIPGSDLFDIGGLCVEWELPPGELELLNTLYTQPQTWSGFFAFEAYRQRLLGMLTPYIRKDISYQDYSIRLVQYAKMFDFIHNHANAQTMVEELSAVQQMPYDKLCRQFRKDFHQSLMDVLGAELIHRAEHLLTETGLSIKEIALALGFSNEFYFSRFFKKHCRMPPLLFRQHYRR